MTPITPTLASLEDYLRLSGVREQMIAANMANVDTPGYRTQDLDFSGELQRAMLADAEGPDGAPVSARMRPASLEVNGLLERPDGNNVDLDREGALLAEVQLQHEIGVQLIKGRFHMLLAAINGGG